MPSATKVTYALDPETLKKVNHLARHWQVSKTEAVRRAVGQAAEREPTLTPAEKIALLHRLQRQFAEAGVDFERWKRDIKRGRR
jgi:hypothetical protein